MSISLGSTNFGSLYLGSTQVAEAYLGSVKVYGPAQPPLELPPYTMRLRYDQGVTPTYDSAVWNFTLVDATQICKITKTA
mgnify:CR=1 FL=1